MKNKCMVFTGVEQKANQVIAASEEIHLEPFKEKMESFFVQGMYIVAFLSTVYPVLYFEKQ